MKANFLTIFLVITFSAANAAVACDKTKESKETKAAAVSKDKKDQPSSSQEQGKVLLTGSYIKQDIRRNGRITDGPNQVIVLDQETIRRSGASDVKQLLVHQGIH